MTEKTNKFSLSWWKILAIVLLIYTVVAGFLLEVPRLDILKETIRNLYFHVPMWMGMVALLIISATYSVKYLLNPKSKFDLIASETVNTALLFGVLGLLTGMLWAQFTWGKYWSGDPKQQGTAIGMLIYLAYVVLRGSFSDDQMRARIGAIYNILALPAFIAFIYILPRLTDSLHPGNGGNPAFSKYDLNATMRLVFYPAVIGFTLLGIWITELRVRLRQAENKLNGID